MWRQRIRMTGHALGRGGRDMKGRQARGDNQVDTAMSQIPSSQTSSSSPSIQSTANAEQNAALPRHSSPLGPLPEPPQPTPAPFLEPEPYPENSSQQPSLGKKKKRTYPCPFPFSLGDRVVDPFRASLTPRMVEALVCTSDWLKSDQPNLYKDPTEDDLEFYYELEGIEHEYDSNPGNEGIDAAFNTKITGSSGQTNKE